MANRAVGLAAAAHAQLAGRLPGGGYAGDEPGWLHDRVAASVELVDAVRPTTIDGAGDDRDQGHPRSRTDGGYVVDNEPQHLARPSVVVASGASNLRSVPLAAARRVPPAVRSLHALDYRNPDQLDERGVLVVGASATRRATRR